MNSFFLPPKPYYSFTRVSSALRTCIPPAIKMSTSVDPPEPILLQVDYPKPLSPPLPAISKEIELGRAMSASSRSSLFSLSASHVLYEDQWLMVVDKPQGIYCESVLESVPSIHLANRLDRDTSGVMVITKSHKVAAKLVKAFTDHKVRKTYIALCIGSAPDWNRITMKSGHGRSKFGAWRVYAASDVGRGLPGGSSVREMETSFEVLSVNGNKRWLNEEECCGETVVVEDKSLKCDSDSSKKQDEILVRAFPRSGRTHQIRLHCQYLGLSIRGDVKYEGVHEWEGKEYSGHQLHAESLSFEHPVTGLPIKVHAPLPSWVIQLSP
ncbi:RNA pseudouridine synthase 1 [Linum perenne]